MSLFIKKIAGVFIILSIVSFATTPHSLVNAQGCTAYDDGGNCISGSSSGDANLSQGSNDSNSSLSSNDSNTGVKTLKNPLSSSITSLGGLVQTFVDVFSYLVILFAILSLIWTGLQYILARGNAERITVLSHRLLWIIIGIAIIIGARVLVQVVINTLSATHVVNNGTLQSVNKAVSGQ